MTNGQIEVLDQDQGIRIINLEVHRPEVARYLRSLPDEEWPSTVARAVEIGVLSLERARMGQDLESVRRELDSLLAQVETAVSKIPGKTQESLLEKVGTGEGQVLAPIERLVTSVSKAANEKIDEVRRLLNEEIDPSRETTTLHRALQALKNLLDPLRSDSIQGSLNASIDKVTKPDGTLAEAVKAVVKETIDPLKEAVKDLTSEVRGEKAAEEALAETIAKGLTYEEEALERLQTWGQGLGAEVTHVGTDNQPGDITIKITDPTDGSSQLMIVVEVRDRKDPKGRKAINDDSLSSMKRREASCAIYLSRNRKGLAKEIGEWAEGICDTGLWVACTDEHLITAVRFLIVQWGIAQRQAETPSVDASAASAQIVRIRTAIRRVIKINRMITELRTVTGNIEIEVVQLRNEVTNALFDMEESLLLKPGNGSEDPIEETPADEDTDLE